MGQLSDGMAALIRYANETTGESDSTLSEAVETLCEGYGQGGVVVDENADVLFIDYDGTLIAGYTLEEAHGLTSLPTPPEHEKLVFVEWNYTLAEVNSLTCRATIGACYTTYNGKCICKVRCLSDNQTVKRPMSYATLDWGDGTIDSNNQHTYASKGVYFIEWAPGGDTLLWNFASHADSYPFEELYFPSGAFTYAWDNCLTQFMISKLVLPIGMTTVGNGFFKEGNLDALILPRGFVDMYWNGFNACLAKRISFPNTMESLGGEWGWSIPSGNKKSRRIDIPSSIRAIGSSTFSLATYDLIEVPEGMTTIPLQFGAQGEIKTLILPSSLTAIENNAFQGGWLGNMIIKSTNCALSGYLGLSTNDGLKIFVPDSAVDDYKAAENWSYYASYIHPLSEWTD